MAKASRTTKPKTLAIDIGGTGLKALVLSPTGDALTDRARVDTPHPSPPQAVLEALDGVVRGLGAFDRISCGFPGVVDEGVVRTAPNLGTDDWKDFPLALALSERFGKPARALNDAGVQGHGVIKGRGTELVLTLGTGMGCALFVRGRYVPNVELAHHPLKKDKTYEEWIGVKALEKVGKKKWNKRVAEVLAHVQPLFNPHAIYLGGGNAKHLKIKLPANVHITDNVAGLLGGIALWERD
jgi:polyphosphate glucokinase